MKNFSFIFLVLILNMSSNVLLFADEEQEDGQIIDIKKIANTDVVMVGVDNAPITMIIYDSITCHHCAEFNTETFEQIKRNYIDTGKVRVVMRDFPLDAIALRLSAMLKCFEDDFDLYQKLRVALFKTQRQWIFQKNDEKRLETAKNILSFANLDREKMDRCMVDEENINFVMEGRHNAIKGGLNATPMFIINGKIYEGLHSYSFFAHKIDEILATIADVVEETEDIVEEMDDILDEMREMAKNNSTLSKKIDELDKATENLADDIDEIQDDIREIADDINNAP